MAYKAYRSKKNRYKSRKVNKTPIIILAVAAFLAVIACGIIFGVIVPRGKEIKSISVNTYPTKVEYYVGDKADFSGLKIGVLQNNGDTYYVDGSQCEITGFDSSKPAESLPVEVKYEGFTCRFFVKINKLPELVKTLARIEVSTLPKTAYKVGESIDTDDGVITLHYSDGSTYRVNLLARHIYGFDTSKPGTYKLLVKYTENGVLCETNYTITVR